MKRISLPPEMSNSSDGVSRRHALRRAAGAGALISLSSLAGFSVSTAEAAGEAIGKLPNHPRWKFIFVAHVNTKPFLGPAPIGAEDACALLGTTFQWTGSEKSIPADMVNAFDAAVSSKADGIALALIDPSAFNDPVEKALADGIPVASYNADTKGNKRLCYIGQDLFLSGKAPGSEDR
jgi:simple sugar transport system substrate-binding protein